MTGIIFGEDMTMDSMLCGIIIILILVVIYKYCTKDNNMYKKKCGCSGRTCTCKTTLTFEERCRIGCPGNCSCGCPPYQCGCPMSCHCNDNYRNTREHLENLRGDSTYIKPPSDKTGPNIDNVEKSEGIPFAAGYSNLSDWQGSITQGMALEDGVSESHSRYTDSLSFAGMPTGASSSTTLEETGRSEGTSNYVGLTARKFCKARQIAAPGCDARQTPSYTPTEYCNVGMEELI
jgi:hypothetical protein